MEASKYKCNKVYISGCNHILFVLDVYLIAFAFVDNNIIKIFPEGKAQDRLLIRAEWNQEFLLEQVHLHYRYYNHDHSHVFGRDYYCLGRNHPHNFMTTNLLTFK